MEAKPFEALAAWLGQRGTRRRGMGLLAALGVSGLGLLSEAEARKKRKKKQKKTHKKTHKKQRCRPQCSRCGGADGCGGTCRCPAGFLCLGGGCTPCTVTCNGDPVACGAALQQRLDRGGIVAVCPGRYQGNFTFWWAQVVGAGNGADPSRDTILDGAGVPGSVVTIRPGGSAEFRAVRITGGNLTTSTASGGGINARDANLTLEDCAVVNNSARNVGGVFANHQVVVSNTTISGNTGQFTGGISLTGAVTPIIINSVISGNSDTSTRAIGSHAGGLRYLGSPGFGPLDLRGTEISGNTSVTAVGGVHVQTGAATFDAGCKIVNNTGPSAGAIRNSGSETVTLNGATVSGNSSPQCANVAGCPA